MHPHMQDMRCFPDLATDPRQEGHSVPPIPSAPQYGVQNMTEGDAAPAHGTRDAEDGASHHRRYWPERWRGLDS